MAFYSKFRDDLSDDLESQVARLQKEVGSLRKALSKRGSHVYSDTRDTAWDLYDDLAERLTDALPHLRRQSRAVQRVATDHPVTTAVVGVAVVGLIVAFLSRR
jgi:ElaB/YqjD/DUF883 family membrane-anchored ribosome-binding protein